jgi:hypothetical protein
MSQPMTIMIALMITMTMMLVSPVSPVTAAPTTPSNTEIYGTKGQSVKFSTCRLLVLFSFGSTKYMLITVYTVLRMTRLYFLSPSSFSMIGWTLDCGLLGQDTIAVFRIVAKIDNVTIENDEYSMQYDQNWDVNLGNNIAGTNNNSTTMTGNVVSTITDGGYKIGQKKVVQFKHIYSESRSYDATLTATIVAPNHPYIHNVQHTANYTIAISDVLCFTTTGMSDSKNDTSRNNNVFSRNNENDDFVPVAPEEIMVQNASSSEQGET